MTKYKEYVQKMFELNGELFGKFRNVHDKYQINQEEHQVEFNRVGEKIMKVIGEFDNKLCASSERGGYGLFTGNLSEKFREEVKRHYPMLDHIGIIAKKSKPQENFTLRKINL